MTVMASGLASHAAEGIVAGEVRMYIQYTHPPFGPCGCIVYEPANTNSHTSVHMPYAKGAVMAAVVVGLTAAVVVDLTAAAVDLTVAAAAAAAVVMVMVMEAVATTMAVASTTQEVDTTMAAAAAAAVAAAAAAAVCSPFVCASVHTTL